MLQMQVDDGTVIAQAVAGDEDAFRRIVDRHSRAIYQLAYRITGRREDAEDVVQDTFIRAYRQLGSFEARSNVSTWLHRIGVNCAIDLVRRRKPLETMEAPEELDRRAANRAGPSPVDLVRAGEITRRIERAMDDLSAKERAAFAMRHFHDCSIDEIANALGLKIDATKHAVFRAVRKMRAALRPFVDESDHD